MYICVIIFEVMVTVLCFVLVEVHVHANICLIKISIDSIYLKYLLGFILLSSFSFLWVGW